MSSHSIRIIKQTDWIESLFEPYREVIGRDFEGYRGHVYRVLTYALHLLGGSHPRQKEIETALVYHDIGLWTDAHLAYLEPSIDLMVKDNRDNAWSLDEPLLRDIVFYHHKISAYRGHAAEIVNAVRKADWIDASGGFLRKGITREQIREVNQAIPEAGFHATLKRLGISLSNGNPIRMTRGFAKVFKI